MRSKLFLYCMCAWILFPHTVTAVEPYRWWPSQAAPRAVVRMVPWEKADITADIPHGATHMLVQSLAGLAAQAVNDGRLDELVWVDTPLPTYATYLEAIIKRLGLEQRGKFTPWQLLERYRDLGIVCGYVLYRFDRAGRPYVLRQTMDHSANVATTMAGLLQGVLIDESQVEQAHKLGLTELFDARDKPADWCLTHHGDRINRNLLLTQDPVEPSNRDMAIAHRCLVAFGVDEPVPTMMKWLEPLSPIMGWNIGDEFSFTGLSTRLGHFQAASTFAPNLTVLSAASEHAPITRLPTLDSKSIDYEKGQHFVSFVMSDGDNLQWMLGDFAGSPNRGYWNNPQHGQFPFGWTTCTSHLAQMCPPALDLLAQTQPPGTSLVEYNGGYYYPDLFGVSRPEPDLLRRHARRMAFHQSQTGLTLLGFICQQVASEEALKAYKVFSEEMPELTGMISVQYQPYEGGGGDVYWVANSGGTEIPVVTPRFSIWGNLLSPTAGTPAKIARLVRQHAAAAQQKGQKSHTLVVVHAWSRFRQAQGDDEQAENVPPESREGESGLTPVAWCIERLGSEITVVSPQELVWRLRHEHEMSASATTLDR